LSIKGDAVLRLPFKEVPRTTSDISAIMTWKKKDGEIYGTQAKKDQALKNYRQDIIKDWGQEKKKKYYFINTFQSKSSFYDNFVEMKEGK